MPIFRKKPVQIEAIPCHHLMANAKHDWNGLPLWFRDLYEKGGVVFTDEGIHLPTLEGTMLAGPTDWIIRGVKGEVYPCKDDIFRASYDLGDPIATVPQVGPRITPDHIKSVLDASTWTDTKMGRKTTVVCLTLPNGFEVIESSGCVDPLNYDHALGVEICKKRIVDQVWKLEGYALAHDLAKAPKS